MKFSVWFNNLLYLVQCMCSMCDEVCGCMQFSSIMLITLAVSLYSRDLFGQGYIYLSSLYYMLTTRVCQSVAMLSTHVTKCVFIIIIVHSP